MLSSTNDSEAAGIIENELRAAIAVLEAEVERLHEEIADRVSAHMTTSNDLHALSKLLHGTEVEVERLQRENGALARTYALAEEKLRERTEALNETLAQNERFNKRYRDAEDEAERLRAALQTYVSRFENVCNGEHDDGCIPCADLRQAKLALGSEALRGRTARMHDAESQVATLEWQLSEATKAAEQFRTALEQIEAGFHMRMSAAELASIARRAL